MQKLICYRIFCETCAQLQERQKDMINIDAIQAKLSALKIPGIVTDINETGFATDISISFNPDVTFSRIKSRVSDLSIFFGCNVEILSRSTEILLKIHNKQREVVASYDFFKEISGGCRKEVLPLVIGQDETGKRLFFDLVKAPHLLAAGSTGSGKSVFVHNCILSHIYSGRSSICLIDVKQVEFSLYEDIPHLAADIAYNSRDALNLLKNLCFTMDNRYTKLKSHGCRNIAEYPGKMQYITLFIDELADLMLSDKRIEKYLVRIAQLGRAAGIHLIVATQRPDATILSGLIRANIPSRVCFAVQKATDSRIILDRTGGEKLQGNGDGLLLPIGQNTPVRFQAAFTPTETIQKVVDIARRKQA